MKAKVNMALPEVSGHESGSSISWCHMPFGVLMLEQTRPS